MKLHGACARKGDNAIGRWMKDAPLMRKMMALFLLLIMIPAFCFGLILFSKSVNDYVRNAVDDAQDVLQTMKVSIEAQAAIVENNLTLLAYDESLLALLSGRLTAGERMVLQINEVSSRIEYASLFLKDMGARITVYPANRDIPESYFSIMRLSHMEGNEGYNAFLAQGETFAWVGMDWARPVDAGRYDINNFRAFVCFREISSRLTKNIGLIKCAVRPDALFAVVDEWHGESDICITRSGEWIYGASGEVGLAAAQQEEPFSLREGDFFFVGAPIGSLGISLLMRMEALSLYQQAYRMNGYLMLVVTMTGILLFFLVRYMLSVIFRRLKQTGSLIQKVEQGDFSVRFPESGKDEIGQLVHATNKLLSCAQSQLTELTQKERSERKAQILALQYQVNPHFLFNTLNWLQMALEIGGTPKEMGNLSEAIALMGETFRYNLAGEPIVLLEEELDNLRQYASLHLLRRPGCLSLSVAVPPEHEHLQVMRFMFQPLVENAIKHGLNGRKHLEVSVSSSFDKGVMAIRVENDGAEIPPAELEMLNQSLHHPPEKAGIGLPNTAARLRLLFGADSSVHVSSSAGAGTSVVLTFRTHP